MSRAEVLLRFAADDELQVRSVLHDLCESGLVSVSGAGAQLDYRVTDAEELESLHHGRGAEGLSELLWALIYREGPLSVNELATRTALDPSELRESLDRLAAEGRIQSSSHTSPPRYHTKELVLPLGSPVGFEAAVFDHFQAMVNTVTCRLNTEPASDHARLIGGSTYTLEVWPGHPLQQRVYGTLARVRSELGELRQQVEQHNARVEIPDEHTKVTLYAGQCLIPQGNPEVSDVD